MAKVLVEVQGTKGLFNANEEVNIVARFESGNYLIESLDGSRRVYVNKEDIQE